MPARAIVGLVLLVLIGGCGSDGAGPAKNTASRGTDRGAAQRPVAAVILDAKGRKLASVRLDGSIDHATADGSGGWYVSIAGKRGARYTLAHLDARGRLDPTWQPALGPSPQDDIYASLAAGGRRVYLAGNFGSIDGVSRHSLGAVAAASGNVDPWPRGNSKVSNATTIIFARDRVIVAYGERIEALDARTGRPVRRFHARTGPDRTEGPGVRALTVTGRWVYMGGRFTKVDGERRIGLARIDRVTGRVDSSWRAPVPDTAPCVGCDGDVMGLATSATSATSIYALGGFSAIGGRRRPGGLAALSQATGEVTGFKPPSLGRDAVGDQGAYLSAAVIGRRLFAAGDFSHAGTIRAHGLVVLDAVSGKPLSSWHPPTRRANVSSVAMSGKQVLVAGSGLR